MTTGSWGPIGNEWGANDLEWEQLKSQLQNGECTPFIGAGACGSRLPVGKHLSLELARALRYPFTDPDELMRVSQFGAWRHFGPLAFKRRVAKFLNDALQPSSSGVDVHRILAGFPLPIYITTNYDNLMVEALRAAGKNPIHRHYPWYTDNNGNRRKSRAERIPTPTAEEPLVYHLHGTGDDCESMVISEADYHTYLANLTLESAGENWSIPAPVIGALARRSLLFVGYSLQDWTFRVLFHGLLNPMAAVLQPGNVSVQLEPELVDTEERTLTDAKDYLRKYYDQLNVSVFWGGSDAFFQKLESYA